MPTYLDIEVSLIGVQPRLWRRFLIAAQASFEELHRAIQRACDWQNAHPYEFHDAAGGQVIAKPLADAMSPAHALPRAASRKLSDVFSAAGQECIYLYDFGDGWRHRVEVLAVLELPERFRRRLSGGERAFPPEDAGGIGGYRECCQAAEAFETVAAAPAGRVWLGSWRPEAFDLAGTRRWFDR